MKEFKVIFLGESGIGTKTSLIERIVENTFCENIYSTIGINSRHIKIKTNFGEIELILIDTAGQERFRSIIENYIKHKDIHCIILGYDITNKNSFESIKKDWYGFVKDNMVGEISLVYLIGNKIDLIEERVVSDEEGISLANDLNMKYFGVSAKTGEGVDILLDDMENSLTTKYLKNKNDDISKFDNTKNFEKSLDKYLNF